MSALNLDGLKNGVKLLEEKQTFVDPKLLAVKPEQGKDNEYEMYLRFLPNLGINARSNIVEKNFVRVSTGQNGESVIMDMPQTKGYTSIFKTFDKILRDMKYNHINEDLVEMIKKDYFSTYSYFYSYVYVEQDPNHHENNGKIMIFRFPYKLKKMIEEAVNGTALKAGCDVFDLLNGKRFYFKIKKQGGFTNYDDCKFENQCPFVYTADLGKGDGPEMLKASEAEIDAMCKGQQTPMSQLFSEQMEGIEKYDYEEPTTDQLTKAATIMRQFLFKYQGLYNSLINDTNDTFMKGLLIGDSDQQPAQAQEVKINQQFSGYSVSNASVGVYQPKPASQQPQAQETSANSDESQSRYKQMLENINNLDMK